MGELTTAGTLTWVALGDSFTAGTGEGEPWSVLVARRLEAACPDVAHANLATAGARAHDVLTRQLPIALSLRPDLVTIIAGANDIVLDVRPDLETLTSTLGDTLSTLSAALPGTELVVATYPDVTRHMALRPRSRARVASGMSALNRVLRRLAGHHGATLVELAGHPGESDRANYADDGFHPSQLGHDRAAEALAAAIAPAAGINLDHLEAGTP